MCIVIAYIRTIPLLGTGETFASIAGGYNFLLSPVPPKSCQEYLHRDEEGVETMIYYTSKAEMYSARANRFKRDGDRHWALARNGDGNYHYGKSKICYEQSKANHVRAEQARAAGETFRSGSSIG